MPVKSTARCVTPADGPVLETTSFIACPLLARFFVPTNQRGFMPFNAAVERTENAIFKPTSTVLCHRGLTASRADARLQALSQVVSFVLGHKISSANCSVRTTLQHAIHEMSATCELQSARHA